MKLLLLVINTIIISATTGWVSQSAHHFMGKVTILPWKKQNSKLKYLAYHISESFSLLSEHHGRKRANINSQKKLIWDWSHGYFFSFFFLGAPFFSWLWYLRGQSLKLLFSIGDHLGMPPCHNQWVFKNATHLFFQ